MSRIRLMAGVLTVGVWTLISRVLGFLRDILIAATLGSGPVAEVFMVAFTLPNMFRRFFAEGAFNAAFVPMFSKKYEAGDDSLRFAQDTFAALTAVLIVVTAIALLAMPWLVIAMASGFLGSERFDLAVVYGRIAFPYILFISLAAMLSGLLNATGRFLAAAAAPVLLNVAFIASITVALTLGWDIGWTMIWTVPFAGIAQMLLVWAAARRAGYTLTPRWPRLTPEIRKLAIIAAPAALAGGVVQINLLVGRQVASFFDGAIVWLSFADRLYQLPLGVVGIAVGIVLLPELSRRLQAGDGAGGREAANRAAEFSLALTVPAAVALLVVPGPLVDVLFRRGAFDSTDVEATAMAVAVYGLGLPAFVLQKVVQPLYFAREDTTSPFRFAVVALIVNAAIAIGLAPVIGFMAAAWGTTIAGWAMLGLLIWKSHQFGDAARIDDRLKARAPRVLGASVLMGAVLWALARVLGDLWLAGGLRYVALLALVSGGIVAYLVFAHLLGAMRLGELRGAVRRGR